MTEFLIGIIIGITVCGCIVYATDALFERRRP